MPRGIYPRKPGTKRGPYRKRRKTVQHRKKGVDPLVSALPAVFDWLRERQIDLLPASVRDQVNEIKKCR
jgi:hypothetical protein